MVKSRSWTPATSCKPCPAWPSPRCGQSHGQMTSDKSTGESLTQLSRRTTHQPTLFSDFAGTIYCVSQISFTRSLSTQSMTKELYLNLKYLLSQARRFHVNPSYSWLTSLRQEFGSLVRIKIRASTTFWTISLPVSSFRAPTTFWTISLTVSSTEDPCFLVEQLLLASLRRWN